MRLMVKIGIQRK